MHKIHSKNISSFRQNRMLPTALARAQSTTPPAPKEVAGTAINITPSLNIGVTGPFSILAGIKLKEETMKLTHDFVSKSPFRKAISNLIAKEEGVSEVVWRESVGALELGPGLCASLPVVETPFGLGLSIDMGFDPSAMLCYRYIRPARIYQGKEKDEAIKDHVAPFPLTVKDAQSMPLGREVEICGTGKLRLREGFSITEGVNVLGVAKVGIGASFAANQTQSGEYALTVMALDGKNQVRVTIRKSNENIKEIGVDFRAGVLNVCAIPIPAFGQGALATIARDGVASLCGVALGFASIVDHVGTGVSRKNDSLCCYDLDLSKEGAQKAYAALLKLDPVVAEQLLLEKDCGISQVSLKERETKNTRAHNFKALNQQIYGKETMSIKRDGMLTQTTGAQILYHDKIHAEKSDNWFTGRRDLEWDGITVKDAKGHLHTYYRFSYEREHKLPQQSYIDRHSRFAKHLGIKSVTEQKTKLIEMNDFIKLFSASDDVKASIELFFTEEGVSRIQKANEAMGMVEFQKANNEPFFSDEKTQSTANTLLLEYQHLASERWSIFGNSEEMNAIIKKYETLFKDHKFEADLALFTKAQEFGKFIGRFTKATDRRSARDFFALLGNANFDYTEVLTALTYLAGRENLKIHNLCLSGGEVSIKSADEGDIIHPREGARLLPGSSLSNSSISYFG